MGVILLVRHGQASWGAADYDNLSEPGQEQGAVLGSGLAPPGSGPAPGRLRAHAPAPPDRGGGCREPRRVDRAT